MSYLDALEDGTNPALDAGTSKTEATISNYLDDVSSGSVAAPSAAEVKNYLDELQNSNAPRATGSGDGQDVGRILSFATQGVPAFVGLRQKRNKAPTVNHFVNAQIIFSFRLVNQGRLF